MADVVEEADAEDGGQRTSLDDPAGGLGVVGVVVVGALEAFCGGGGEGGVLECLRPGLGNLRQLRGAELLRPVALLERDAPFG